MVHVVLSDMTDEAFPNIQPNFNKPSQFWETLGCFVDVGTFVRVGLQEDDDYLVARIIDFVGRDEVVEAVIINPYFPIEESLLDYPCIPPCRAEPLPEVVQSDFMFDVPPENIQQFTFVFSLVEITMRGIVANQAKNLYLVRYRSDRSSVHGIHWAFPFEQHRCSHARSTSRKVFTDWERIRDCIDLILNRVTEKQGLVRKEHTVICDETWSYVDSMLYPKQAATRSFSATSCLSQYFNIHLYISTSIMINQ